MALNNWKRSLSEINNTKCVIIETGITKDRMTFLKAIFDFNKIDTVDGVDEKEEGSPEETYSIGVIDLIFNPILAVYRKSLLSPEGHHVSPAYWDQLKLIEDACYWQYTQRGDEPNKELYPWAWPSV